MNLNPDHRERRNRERRPRRDKGLRNDNYYGGNQVFHQNMPRRTSRKKNLHRDNWQDKEGGHYHGGHRDHRDHRNDHREHRERRYGGPRHQNYFGGNDQ